MSAKIMGNAMDLDLPRAEMFILLAYADHADHNGENCFPGVELIAWKTGYTMKQVSKIVAALEKRGIMEVVHRGTGRNKRTEYRIRLEKGEKKPPYSPGAIRAAEKGKGEEKTPIEKTKGGTSESERGNFPDGKGELPTPPIKNNHVTKSNRQSAATPREDPIFETLAEVCGIDWKQPMTDNERGRLNQAAKQLRTVEASPIEIRRRAAAYRRKWPNVELTPQALINQWSQCLADPSAAAAAARVPADPEIAKAQELEMDALGLWRLMLEPAELKRQPGESAADWHGRVKAAWQKTHGLKGRSQNEHA